MLRGLTLTVNRHIDRTCDELCARRVSPDRPHLSPAPPPSPLDPDRLRSLLARPPG